MSVCENLKLLLTCHPHVEMLPIFVLRVGKVKNSTSIRVRYLIAPGGDGPTALIDITGRIARVLDCFNRYNDKDGTFLVKGGDGSDAINSLSILLFGDHQKIPVYSI